ncbi:MAG: hypothetical protein PHX38_10740 [Sulfuricella sp.]|nr:hypothetical protein [Sulfuricella sp.]
MREAMLGLLGLAIAALLAALVYQNQRRFHKPLITTPYQAVTLQNGTVFYGRIDHLGTDYPVLRDAFTLRVDSSGTEGPTYSLVRRKDEPNGADHIILPAASIAFVEPVRPDSEVGRLIGQAGVR